MSMLYRAPLNHSTSKGTHALIKEGAHLVDDPQDLLTSIFSRGRSQGAHAVELFI